MTSELEEKIAKYQKAAAACNSDVERSQYLQLVRELEGRRPIKLHMAEEAVCDACQ